MLPESTGKLSFSTVIIVKPPMKNVLNEVQFMNKGGKNCIHPEPV